MRRKSVASFAAVAAVSLAMATGAPALADSVVADGDGVVPVADQNVALGNVCAGSVVSQGVLVAIQRASGGSNNTFKDASSVTFSTNAGSASSPSLAATSLSPTITMPSDWGTQPVGTLSPASLWDVSTTVPAALGAFSVSFAVTADGTDATAAAGTLTRQDQISVTGTSVTCGPSDTTPPSVTVDQASTQADPTNSSTVNFTVVFSEVVSGFTASDVTLGGTATGTLVASVTGSGTTYNVAVSGMAGDGTVTASLPAGVASDAAGNGNTASVSVDNTVTVDTTAPEVTLVAPAAGAVTGDSTPEFSGAAGTATGDDSGVTVKIYSGSDTTGTLVQTLTTARSGSGWLVSPTTALPDGSYTAVAAQSDAAGNTGTSTANTFRVDTIPPAVTLTTPANAGLTNDRTPTFAGAAGDDTGDATGVTVKVYSGSDTTGTLMATLSATRTAATWTVDAGSDLTDGTYTAVATQIDSAGNTGTSTANTFTVDATAPVVTVTAPAAGATVHVSKPAITGTAGTAAGDGASVTVKLYYSATATSSADETGSVTVSSGTWSYTPATSVPEGPITVVASQSDSAGNVGTATRTFTFAKAATSLLYTGKQIVIVPNALALAATLSAETAACADNQTVTFSLDRSPVSGAVSPFALATTQTVSGSALASAATDSWLPGTYVLTTAFGGTADCQAATYDASLTVGSAGDAANGGGWYTMSSNGRVNFGFTVQTVPGTGTSSSNPAKYKGQLLLINNGKWRLKGSLNSYVKATAGQGSASGTGTLQVWDATLNFGLGDWSTVSTGVAFTAQFVDTGTKSKTADQFGISIQYALAAGQPALPNSSTPISLKGGDIKVS